jgi:hypothetical protein
MSHRGRFITLVLLVSSGCAAVVAAENGDAYPRPYDGFQASAEAAQRQDLRRRGEIAMQLATIEQIKWYAGYPSSFHAPPSLARVYAFGPGSAYFRRPLWSSTAPLGVFEPWPLVPGDIWGYPWYDYVPQPIGRIEIQTGPNRWESHPVYAPLPDAVPDVTGPPKSSSPREF